MNTTKNTECTFKVQKFMHTELKLSGNELIVFALIHSFTMGTNGLYFGSQQRLSELCGIANSTSRRLVKSLLEKAYIEKCEEYGRWGYRSKIKEEEIFKNLCKAEKATSKAEKTVENEEKKAQTPAEKAKAEAASEKKSETEKAEKKKILISVDPPLYIYEGDDDEELCEDFDDEFEDEPDPKYTFEFFGSPGGGNIFMTRQQYAALQRLVDTDSLTGYISKLDRIMIRDGYRTFNPYKTIKRWIEEDAAL